MSLLSTIGKGLGTLLGGVVGGPAGAAVGAAVTGSIFGGGGSNQPYGPPPGVPGNINLPAIGGQTSINLPGLGAPGFGVTYTPTSALQQQGTQIGNLQLVTNVQTVQRNVAPKGYVVVQTPQGPRAVVKEVAYALGLAKRPRRGGGLTRRDIQGAYRTQALVKRLTVCKPKHALKSRGKKR